MSSKISILDGDMRRAFFVQSAPGSGASHGAAGKHRELGGMDLGWWVQKAPHQCAGTPTVVFLTTAILSKSRNKGEL